MYRAPPEPAASTDRYHRDSAAHLTARGWRLQRAAAGDARTSSTIDAGLTAIDGQTLGYTWAGIVENWHRTAFTSFGDGHGVWETSGGRVLPFYARNFRDVKQWAAPLEADDLMPTIRRTARRRFSIRPPVDPDESHDSASPTIAFSRTASTSSKALGPNGTGLVWAAVENGELDSKRHGATVQAARASLVQVTNLGITVKDSPQNTLVFVTRLDNGCAGRRREGLDRQPRQQPALDRHDRRGRRRDRAGVDIASGATPAKTTTRVGAAATSSSWPRRTATSPTSAATGTKASSRGTSACRSTCDEADADAARHGVQRSRRLSARRRSALQGDPSAEHAERHPAAARRHAGLRHAPRQPVSRRRRAHGEASTPGAAPNGRRRCRRRARSGNYSVRAVLESDRAEAEGARGRCSPARRPSPELDDDVPYQKVVNGSFLVAAYRRPDFRVDVSAEGRSRDGRRAAERRRDGALPVRRRRWARGR